MQRRFRKMVGVAAAIGVAMGARPVMAESVYGWVEKAEIEPWGVEVKAKLDSGALTSSMHAEHLERYQQDGEEWVRFTLDVVGEDSGERFSREIERPVFRNLIVRGAGGEERRAVVLMKLCLGDTIHEEQVSLNDRSDMLYPLLLGRRTIQHLGMLDVTRTFIHQPGCGDDAPFKAHDEQRSDEDIGA
ncbi:retropepsin-like aspartic peptidase RloA3 [Modicisalibacter radicis]|uniref:retropepsin-like aspartic peptidase RloA3 n=1 Tax=Halomonas sp. EAR18 TaxID=2518972 RepID=UPI00109CEEBC|nr:ATP-dependent zinc protease [Halomonas sp. EAR18]